MLLLQGLSPRRSQLPDDVGAPFSGPQARPRAVPFAAVALIAEVSLLLSPGLNVAAACVSASLFALTCTAFVIPWQRLPTWSTVVVPLLYVASVTELSIATGPASGVGVVLFLPVVWTALYQRPWESLTVSVSVVVAEVAVSLIQHATNAVTLRRAVFYALVNVLVSASIQGLRETARRAQARGEDLAVSGDRTRIALGIQKEVISKMFGITLQLQGAAQLLSAPEARERIEGSVQDLDESMRLLRDTVFGLSDAIPPAGEAMGGAPAET
ncbi:MAG TPA: histidine kinase dimerization/phosphoacceptor domain-containing protein [Acidimicrobiales bacterium]|nr:histidine kinase dimerization/phosphoacceptor domain-containing protein [Acidimicrobiales bacterium]